MLRATWSQPRRRHLLLRRGQQPGAEAATRAGRLVPRGTRRSRIRPTSTRTAPRAGHRRRRGRRRHSNAVRRLQPVAAALKALISCVKALPQAIASASPVPRARPHPSSALSAARRSWPVRTTPPASLQAEASLGHGRAATTRPASTRQGPTGRRDFARRPAAGTHAPPERLAPGHRPAVRHRHPAGSGGNSTPHEALAAPTPARRSATHACPAARPAPPGARCRRRGRRAAAAAQRTGGRRS